MTKFYHCQLPRPRHNLKISYQTSNTSYAHRCQLMGAVISSQNIPKTPLKFESYQVSLQEFQLPQVEIKFTFQIPMSFIYGIGIDNRVCISIDQQLVFHAFDSTFFVLLLKNIPSTWNVSRAFQTVFQRVSFFLFYVSLRCWARRSSV